MSGPAVLNSGDLAALLDAYRAYEAAQLGDLNRTAEALWAACKVCGAPWNEATSFRSWARGFLLDHGFRV